MRLIDADNMLKKNESSIYDTTDLKEMIYNEPTAYDIDKIVERIRKLYDCDNCNNHNKEDCSWCTVKECMDIVSRKEINGK